MALLWMDGFDHYGTGSVGEANAQDGVWAQLVACSIVNTRSRTGSCSLRANGTLAGLGARRVFPGGTKPIVGIGYALWMDDLPTSDNSQQIFSVHNAANEARVSIGMDTTGRATLHLGQINSVPVFTTEAPVFVTGAWQFLEARFDTAGSVEFRINGVTVINESGLTLPNTGAFAQVVIGPRSFVGSGHQPMWIDDIFCWDTAGSYNNDFIGDRRVRTVFPDGDESPQEWTPVGAAMGYECIDDAVPDDDSTYLLAEPLDSTSPPMPTVSRFAMGAIPEEVAGISAVQTYVRSRKTEAGDCNIQVGLVSGGQEAVGADRPITSVWTYWMDVFEVDPNTGAPWTQAALDAASVQLARTL